MSSPSLQDLLDRLRTGAIDRRTFFRRAAAAGVSASMATALARSVGAQATPDASPEASPAASPAASPVAGPVTKSITRDDYLIALKDHFGFTKPENTGGEVILASNSDIGTLNPIIRVDINALFLLNNMFNQLATQSIIDGSPAPDLADYWESSADFMSYTFFLNENATWHDGQPITSADVIFSYESAMDETGISPYRADLIGNIAAITAIDDHTVRIDAKEAIAVFLYKTALLVPIVPKHVWESIPVANWGSAPAATGSDPAQVIGSGPFRFVEWVPSDHATMERWDDYWVPEGKATIDRATFRVVPDVSTALQTLKTGESDITGIPPQKIKDFEGNPDVTIAMADAWGWSLFTPQQEPSIAKFFHEKPVRQAMMFALDRAMMLETIHAGVGTVAEGMQPVPSRAYAPDRLTTHYAFDPEKAKTLLEEAGWVDADGDGIRERDGVTFSTEFYYESGDAVNDQMVTYMQQAWKEIGVEIIPTPLVQATLIEQIVSKNDYQLGMIGISWTDEDQGILYRSDAWPEKGGFNITRYANPEFDKLNDAQLREFDVDKRMAIIEESNNILNEDVAIGILFFGKGVVGFQSRLQNYAQSGFGSYWQMPYIWIKQ